MASTNTTIDWIERLNNDNYLDKNDFIDLLKYLSNFRSPSLGGFISLIESIIKNDMLMAMDKISFFKTLFLFRHFQSLNSINDFYDIGVSSSTSSLSKLPYFSGLLLTSNELSLNSDKIVNQLIILLDDAICDIGDDQLELLLNLLPLLPNNKLRLLDVKVGNAVFYIFIFINRYDRC